MNKTMLAILEVLANRLEIVGSREIARELELKGISIAERTVRYYLKILDERGYTEVFGKEGRRITEKGRIELNHAMVSERLGFVISKIETLSFLTTFDIESMDGNVILNISSFPVERVEEVKRLLSQIFSSTYVVSDRIAVARGGKRIGDFSVPDNKIAIGTICSVTINGIFLKSGIPVNSRFGGVLEISNKKPKRFISIINYDGTSLDPHEIFIKSKMTNVIGAIRGMYGEVLASFREIPVVSLEKAKELAEKLDQKGIKGILKIGEPNSPLLEVSVGIDKVGMVIVGGLNPIAALEEVGIPTESKAMAIFYRFSELLPYKEAFKNI